jgi:pteridine reductase
MPSPSPRPVALVTGSAKRFGAAIARHLHASGFDLALQYRHSDDEARALADALEAARPGSVLLLRDPLREPDAMAALVAAVVARFGRLDALVNNASAFYRTPIGEATAAHWDELFGANARAPFFLAQAAAPHLRATRGAIVNLTDIHAARPPKGLNVYAMSKAALVAMTRALAVELAPEVRVNAIAPGAILWPEDGMAEAAQAAILARVPLGRTGTPEEIAEAVRWLLRDATYLTGAELALDGGRSVLS